VRGCVVGTAPVELEIKTQFESVFGIPVLENFALSETTFFTCETMDARNTRSEGSVGGVLPWAELRFLPYRSEEDDAGETPTEILVKTPFLFVGYLREGGVVERQLDPDGFFATGDLGWLDERGQLRITGRRRDIVKKGGYFVSLREIEVLACQHAAVEEAAAVGVPHAVYGEDLILYVRLNDAANEKLADVSQWLRANLVKYKWPERFVAVEDFPRTPSGKIRKHLLARPEGYE
jgi:acyl-CoA synthetase (AMP-forming)/AMP-acid ligase II